MKPVADAARELGIRPGTLRGWISDGCPARRGRRGRGNATLVDVDAVTRWREASASDDSERTALLEEMVAAIPDLIAGAVIQALADASPHTEGGAELRRLRTALGDAARRSSNALIHYVESKSKQER